MKRLTIAAVGVFLMFATDGEAAGWSHRYVPMPRGRTEAVAALPDGGLVSVASGATNAILLLGADGQVRVSRSVTGIPVAVTAAPDGAIFAGLISESRTVITKLRADLDVVWSRRIDAGDLPAAISMIRATNDGGVLVAGGGFLVKVDSAGRVTWSTRIASAQLQAAIPAKDGGYVCAGSYEGYPWVAKLSKEGKPLWQRTYGEVSGRFRSVIETERGYAVAGQSEKQGIVARLDATGAAMWAGLTATPAGAHAIAATPKGYVVAGQAGGEMQITVFDENGSTGWMRLLRPSSEMVYEDQHIGQIFARVKDGVVVSLPIKPSDDANRSSVLLHKLDDAGNTLCTASRPDGVVFVPVQLSSRAAPATVAAGGIELATATIVTAPVTVAARPENCGPDEEFRIPEAVAWFKIDDWETIAADAKRYRALLKAKDFDALEKIAAELRSSRSGDPLRPHRRLSRFYNAFDGPAAEEGTQLALLREWTEKRPRSIAAPVALANALIEAGWRRRGGGFAPTVTDVGWAEFSRLLDEAAAALSRPREGIESDPLYWSLAIALARHRGTGDVMALAREGLTLHADGDIALSAMRLLLPRWGGSPELVMRLADEATALTKKTHGEAFYMWLAYQIANESLTGRENFADYSFDWARVRQGGRDAIALAPNWPPTYQRLAMLAWMFKDRETARELFSRKELDWYPDALAHWQSTGRYEDVRRWALPDEPPAVTRAKSAYPPPPPVQPAPPPVRIESKPAAPRASFMAPRLSNWPQMLFEMRVTLRDTPYEHVAGFLVETMRGVIAVSVVPPEPFHVTNPDALERLKEGFTRAEISIPSAPKSQQTLAVASLLPAGPPARRATVAMNIKHTQKPPIEVLKLHRIAAPGDLLSRPAFIVGCTWDGPRCRQTVFEGILAGMSTSNPGSLREVTIGLKEAVPLESFIGAAVLDADGFVIAIATGREGGRSSEHATLVYAELLDTIDP